MPYTYYQFELCFQYSIFLISCVQGYDWLDKYVEAFYEWMAKAMLGTEDGLDGVMDSH